MYEIMIENKSLGLFLFIFSFGGQEKTELIFFFLSQILWRGQEKIMDDAATPEEWDRKAGIRVVEGI